MAEQMKPSGIDGIGDIPIDWVVTPMKYLVDFYNGDRSENYPSRNEFVSDGIPFINAGHLLNGTLDFENLDYISEEKYKSMGGVKLSKNDIVYCLRGSLGKNAFINIDNGTVASSLVAIRSKNIHPKYLFYIINSHIEETQRLLWDNGTAQPNLSADNLGKFYICVPPVKDQHIIAIFLDKQCGRVDEIISDLEKQIETLQKYKKSLILETVTKGLNKNAPMKPSGIDWIGDIPKHWEINKIKYLFSIVNGSTPESNDSNCWDGDINWITPADMEDFGEIALGERNITAFGYDSCGTSLLPIGSIVISTRAPIGKINITTGVLCTNQGCKSLVSNKWNKYFYYLLYVLKDQLTFLGRGTTFLELSTSALANFKIIIPKDEEQICIVDYLDCQCAKIDSILTDMQEQLEKIKQHKKSLIYEYVTGKKRVREATNGN